MSKTPKTPKGKARAMALKHGYRSGLEDSNAKLLKKRKVPFEYEKHKIKWLDSKTRKYTPDFLLPNGILIETKGRFTVADRRKHLEIKKQYPELDIRFVFTNPNAKLSKVSNTTYAQWCKRYGFRYARQEIPQEWIDERKEDYERKAIQECFDSAR